MVAPVKTATVTKTAATATKTDAKSSTKKKIVKKTAPVAPTKKAASRRKAPVKKTEPQTDSTSSTTSTTSTTSTDSITNTTNTTDTSNTPTAVEQTPQKTQTKRKPATRTKKAGQAKKPTSGPRKTIKKKSSVRKPKQVPAAASDDQTQTQTQQTPESTPKPSSKKRKSSKRKGSAKPRVHIPRGIHNIIESVKKYEERIRQLSDADFKALNDSYISSYTIWIDPKTWKMETIKASSMSQEEREAKPCFLTQLETMDELMGHALHYSDVNSAIIEGLRMMVLMKVATERGVKIFGIVGEKQSQIEPKGPKHWKLDPKEGRSVVVTQLEDGSEVVDKMDENGNTVRLINGTLSTEKQLPKMNWTPNGARVCYVGGIQRFPFDRPLFASKFALKNADYVKYKPLEYKEVSDLDIHCKDIPLASQYPLFV